jgi:hypothetical protein
MHEKRLDKIAIIKEIFYFMNVEKNYKYFLFINKLSIKEPAEYQYKISKILLNDF